MVLTTHKGALALVAIAAVAVGVLLFSISSLASPETGGGSQAFVDVNVMDGDDPDGHAEFIEMPNQLKLSLTFTTEGPLTFITISGAPPWVEVTGAIENGQIFASGSGKVAMIQNIAVEFEGKLDLDGQLSGEYRMGTALGLPPDLLGDSHPITYTLKAGDPPAPPTPTATPTPTEPGLAAPTDTPPPPSVPTPTATPTPTEPGLAAPTDTPTPPLALTPTATPTDTPVQSGITILGKLDLDHNVLLVGWEMRVFAGEGCTGLSILTGLTADEGGPLGPGFVVTLPLGVYSVAETQQPGWERGLGTPFCQDFNSGGDGVIFGNIRIRNGDVNGDGVTDSIDVLLVLQAIAGLTSASPDDIRADVNEDGVVDSIDAALMLQFEAGQLDSLPVGR